MSGKNMDIFEKYFGKSKPKYEGGDWDFGVVKVNPLLYPDCFENQIQETF